jgi:hypothetical protein
MSNIWLFSGDGKYKSELRIGTFLWLGELSVWLVSETRVYANYPLNYVCPLLVCIFDA